MMIAGDPTRNGATADKGGVNFALFAPAATRVELCLFDARGREKKYDMPAQSQGVWHGYLPKAKAGQQYGYRVHGRWDPEQGLRFNPAKLLLDPYAKAHSDTFTWHEALFAHTQADASIADHRDSAPFMAKGIVTSMASQNLRRPHIAWNDSVIYETNVRGFTMRAEHINARERGKFAGLSNKKIIEYVKALGITAIELLPVHSFVDEHFLAQRGLKNYWGYNTLNFFTPAPRYAHENAISEFRSMVNALHDANIEVLLDVVYNHTAEGDERGPTLSLRGIDNLAYYRILPHTPQHYVNDTGTGNTLNADHPAARQLVLESLRYWAQDMGVDGFRFDLAPILGRHFTGFSNTHPLLSAISQDSVLKHTKLIAEPWDIGPGGYQLGHFPSNWAEWNDRYRDITRRYWRGDDRQTPAMARRLHGSADIFEASGRGPCASVNFITSHDGFTLADLVSYEKPNNHANGEDNRDGHQHNFSQNFGAEGASDSASIKTLRRQARLNLLATLLFSQGTPMLLAGDERGHSQQGNNNAYAQDNKTTWLDWDNPDPAFTEQVGELIRLRAQLALLRQNDYRHGHTSNVDDHRDIEWLAPDGHPLHGIDWHHADAITQLLVATPNDNPISEQQAVAILLNPSQQSVDFHLPTIKPGSIWQLAFHSAPATIESNTITVPAQSIALTIVD